MAAEEPFDWFSTCAAIVAVRAGMARCRRVVVSGGSAGAVAVVQLRRVELAGKWARPLFRSSLVSSHTVVFSPPLLVRNACALKQCVGSAHPPSLRFTDGRVRDGPRGGHGGKYLLVLSARRGRQL